MSIVIISFMGRYDSCCWGRSCFTMWWTQNSGSVGENRFNVKGLSLCKTESSGFLLASLCMFTFCFDESDSNERHHVKLGSSIIEAIQS